MEKLKEAKKHFSKIGWLFVIAIVIIYGLEIIEHLVVGRFLPDWEQRSEVVLFLSVLPMYFCAFPLLIMWLKRFVPAVTLTKYKMSPGQYIVALITCMGLAYASNFAGTFLGGLIGLLTKKPATNVAQELTSQLPPWMIFVYVVLMAPIMEEYIFRKLIVDRTVRYGQGVAILLSGLMFGLFHGNLNQFCYTVVIGFFLGFIYLKTGNIKITISMHMIFNFIGGLLPSLVFRNGELQKILELLAEGASDAEIFEQLGLSLGIILFMFFLGLYVICVTIAGVILCIVFVCMGKFRLKHFEGELPKKKRFTTVICNTGMLTFIGFWVVVIVRGLFV